MHSWKKATGTIYIFKWKRRRESSLIRELLGDVPPDIELSDYQRFPSSGSASPSGLLNAFILQIQRFRPHHGNPFLKKFSGVLAFPISQWIPGTGPTVNYGKNRRETRKVIYVKQDS
ncbi:Autophagy-related protein [Thalictrum thalictroides]|uniref:Autophagy-related protein n=1 Tax=Thalictrum thalictroides TaxID=46969 RepID=A0A7J6VSG7_THATH|nr:Autophagy-related protein [Thalictrum thalictroides]